MADPSGGKRCRHCGELKPLEQFHRDRSVKDGRRPECKACTAAKRRARYRKDPAAEIARVKAWQQANSERLNAYRRQRRSDPAVRRRDRSGHLRRKFGITIDEYEARLARQGGGCAICGRDEPPAGSLHVDHDHDSGRVRALLCVRCNNGIALFDEDPALLRYAADYVATARRITGLQRGGAVGEGPR
jgi:hypothetical protein